MPTQTEWEARAANLLKAELKRTGAAPVFATPFAKQ